MPPDLPTKGPRRAVRIGKYDVLAHIATGGMGAVYRAVDTELGREVALKVLAPETAAKPATLERFRREARHSAKLHHENIVTLYECGEANGTYYLAMEFVDGVDLHDYIDRKGQLDPEEARQILIQAAQALDHAHKQNIVHRDIKPSNLLLTQREGRQVVKLTDMGLAREINETESRVTRDGSTVGTVDYLSPEQARDSSAADIRSDMYSLGCTAYHMLAGKPPFPSGGLAERIYKHIQAEPPDIRQLNLQVSDTFWVLLKRMLAKDPARRYQTPAALLKDLLQLDSVAGPGPRRDVESELIAIEEPATEGPPRAPAQEKVKEKKPPSDPEPQRLSAAPKRAASRPARRTREQADPVERSAAKVRPTLTRRNPWPWVAGAAIGVLLLSAGVGLALWLMARPHPTPPDEVPPVVIQPPPVHDPEWEVLRVAPRLLVENSKPSTPKSRWPWLHPSLAAWDAEPLRREFEQPWSGQPALPTDTPVLRVARNPRGGGEQFESLAAAVATTAPGRTAIIEIHDNGPLFELPATAADRSLIIRAGKGYRPLLVWDVERARANGPLPTAFLSVSRGNLSLEGIDLVLGGADANAPLPGGLLQVTDGDFLARECTFSVAGKADASVTLLRFEGTNTEGKKCRLSRCHARGAPLVALDLRAAGAEVLLDGCLLVGGNWPLLQVAAAEVRPPGLSDRKTTPPVLRVLRSTLVAGQTLLQLKPALPEDRQPDLRWYSWDTLLARFSAKPTGDLIAVAAGAEPTRIRWQAVNCVYAGWKSLLNGGGAGSIPATDHAAWCQRWQLKEADAVVTPRWPVVMPQDPAEATVEFYRAEDVPLGFAATSGPGVLGCDLALLPPVRDRWLTLAYQPFATPPVDLLMDATPPDIPSPGDDLYHGGRIDLMHASMDLGAHLRELQRSGKKFAPRVVLHLVGSGEVTTSPIRLKGTSLVLYFETPEKREGMPTPPPLWLTPRNSFASVPGPLIEVEDGDLEITNGDIRFAESTIRKALIPPYLLRVRGGNLLLYGCRLQGPRAQQIPDLYQGLILFEGANEEDPELAPQCALNRSVLVSGKVGLHLRGTGAHVRLHQCAVVTTQEAIRLDPGPSPEKTTARVRARLNLHCLLEHSTVAARRAVVCLANAPSFTTPLEPIIIQARSCAFLNPYPGASAKESHPAGVFLFEGDMLARGLLLWQGEGNVFDKRLHYFAWPTTGPLPEQRQSFAGWARLWGPVGEKQPVLDVTPAGRMDANLSQFDCLALPRLDRTPGANLTQLGLLKPKSPK